MFHTLVVVEVDGRSNGGAGGAGGAGGGGAAGNGPGSNFSWWPQDLLILVVEVEVLLVVN